MKGELILPPAASKQTETFFANELVKVIPGLIKEEGDKTAWLVSSAKEMNAWTRAAEAKAKDVNCIVSYNSLKQAVFNAAHLNLMLGTTLGQCYLVPMHLDKRKRSERIECQLWMGYEGFQLLGFRTGILTSVHTDVVLDGDEFERWTDEDGPHFRHVQANERATLGVEPTAIQGAYCVYKLDKGGRGFEYVDRSQLAPLLRRGHVWKSNPYMMARKTAVLRAAKNWPKHTRSSAGELLKQASYIDEQADRDETQDALTQMPAESLPTPDLNENPPEWFGELLERLSVCDDQEEYNNIRDEFEEIAGNNEELAFLEAQLKQWWHVEGPGE